MYFRCASGWPSINTRPEEKTVFGKLCRNPHRRGRGTRLKGRVGEREKPTIPPRGYSMARERESVCVYIRRKRRTPATNAKGRKTIAARARWAKNEWQKMRHNEENACALVGRIHLGTSAAAKERARARRSIILVASAFAAPGLNKNWLGRGEKRGAEAKKREQRGQSARSRTRISGPSPSPPLDFGNFARIA